MLVIYPPKPGGGDHVLLDLRPIQRALQLPSFIIVSGVAAHRVQRIGRKRDKARFGDPAGNIFDIGIEASILMHDQYRSRRLGHRFRNDEIPSALSVPVG